MKRTTQLFLAVVVFLVSAAAQPVPMLDSKTKVDWWFVFKFNTKTFKNSCPASKRKCPFGGTVQNYKEFCQQYAFASSANPALQQGGPCLGTATSDPVGATFSQVYKSKKYFYVVWNDQFYGDPIENTGAPAGHSKGMLAWDKNGDGFVMQVTTPDWPGSASSASPRTRGNTLGCTGDNDIRFSQHFFALKLNKADVAAVLKSIAHAGVVTNTADKQIVKNGGPSDIQELVNGVGGDAGGTDVQQAKLSSGVLVVAKPSGLHVPPWQMMSSVLGGEPLRAATWWEPTEDFRIPSTTASTEVKCWSPSLTTPPNAVEIATAGTWQGMTIGLEGGLAADRNHAKIGVSTGTHNYAIFGDMNQEGSLSGPNCKSAQNGRGGLFFVIENKTLHDAVRDLIGSQTAPTT